MFLYDSVALGFGLELRRYKRPADMTEDYWYRRGSWDIGEACVHRLSCNVDRRTGDNSTEYVRIACKNHIDVVDI